MKKFAFALSWLLLSLFVTACSPVVPPAQPTESPLQTPSSFESPLSTSVALATSTPVATPESGQAAAQGRLLNAKNGAPIPVTQFYFKPVDDGAESGQWTLILVGPEPAKGDIASESGPQGEISINNIPPGKYIMLVWAPYNWIPVGSDDPEVRPQIFEFKADQVTDLGALALSWP